MPCSLYYTCIFTYPLLGLGCKTSRVLHDTNFCREEMPRGTPDFNGERLREARLACGLTGVELAERVEISRGSISAYERGDSTPSSSVFDRIIDELGQPPEFFLEEHTGQHREPIFYRRLLKTTNREKDQLQAQYRWVSRIFQFLREHVEFPAVDVPTLEDLGFEDALSLELDEIELVANEARKHWGFGRGPIGNAIRHAENSGIVVSAYNFQSPSIDGFSCWDSQHHRPSIVLATNDTTCVRSRFSACHEIFHLIAHRDIDEETLQDSETYKRLEKQAHRFAGAFLFPAESFRKEVPQSAKMSLDRLRHLKRTWRCSIAMMVYRAFHVGRIDEEERKRLYGQMGYRGWMTKEPLDEQLEPEQPSYLGRAIEMLISDGAKTPEDIEYEVGINRRWIEKLTGLEDGYLSPSSSGSEQPLRLKGSE